MLTTRVLLMYIGFNSGHHRAALAVEKALHLINPEVSTLTINSFSYTNPILEKIVTQTYLEIIKRKPEVWEYLYDNRRIAEKTRRLRELIHRYNSSKLRALLDNFQPQAVVCTQAFPCGMVADYKRSCNKKLPLVGVLTDYALHLYWLDEEVDLYLVPSVAPREKLVASGVSPEKVKISGIPVDPKFSRRLDRGILRKKLEMEKDAFVVLIMGGNQGLGPIRETIAALDRLDAPVEVVVVTGANKRLKANLEKRKRSFKKKISVFGFREDIDELMEAADLLITKPGGLTTAEALTKGLPMVIVNPIPGQEAKNTQYLLEKKVARMAKDAEGIPGILEELITHKDELLRMKRRTEQVCRPQSAGEAARFILGLGEGAE